MFDLTGKKALVTGASGGIGEAIARVLHRQGAAVAVSGTRRDALETLATDLAVAGEGLGTAPRRGVRRRLRPRAVGFDRDGFAPLD